MPVSYLTGAVTGTRLLCDVAMSREPTMSPAHDSQSDREQIDPQSIATAVQVVSAWLIAFVCVSLIALLS